MFRKICDLGDAATFLLLRLVQFVALIFCIGYFIYAIVG